VKADKSMSLDISLECKACKEHLELVTAPKGHQEHLHFRCRCMPPDGLLCVLMRACQASVVKG
jgi:hypothetical protein